MLTTESIDGLVQILVRANTAYRNGNPIMPDAEYDALEEQLRQLDPVNPFLKKLADEDTVVVASGATEDRRFNTEVPLTIPMGSQQKALTLDDGNLARFAKDVGSDDWFHSLKVDGMSMELTYDGGTFIQAVTRGDGKIGVDVTAIVRDIPSVPKTIPETAKLVVRGEVCMFKSAFTDLNAQLVKDGKDPVKNTRNGTVGIVKTLKNRAYAKYLHFLAFNMQYAA